MIRKRSERRCCKRTELSCPLIVLDDKGHVLFKIRTVNVSDSGVYFETPASNLPHGGMPGDMALRISVPRSTANTFMLEEFQANARLVRAEPLASEDLAAMALEFTEPLAMDLDT